MKPDPSKTAYARRRPKRGSASYWRTRYEQLRSDFDELLSVNQALVLRNAALEGMTVISRNPPRPARGTIP